jgi:hypothetical protein
MAKITLSNERYLGLLEAERMLHDSLSEMDRAEKCGIDCDNLRSIHGAYREQIEALKTNYGPTNPNRLGEGYQRGAS